MSATHIHTHSHSYRMINSWAFLQSTNCFLCFGSAVYLPISFCCNFYSLKIHASCMRTFHFHFHLVFLFSFLIHLDTYRRTVQCTVRYSKSGRDFGICKPCNQRTLKDDWVELRIIAEHIYVEVTFFLNALDVSLDWNSCKNLSGHHSISLCIFLLSLSCSSVWLIKMFSRGNKTDFRHFPSKPKFNFSISNSYRKSVLKQTTNRKNRIQIISESN